MGHSTGGLFAQMLAGRGLSAATVAIDPGIFRGVLPLPRSTLKVSGPILLNPRNRGRAITLTFDQFKYGWTNALDEDEAKRLYDTYHVAGSGIALAQMANANLNPWTESKVDTKNPERGPLLILDGENDHTVPWAIANASYKRQKRNPASQRSRRCPTAATRSPSTTAGRRSLRPRSTSSSGSSRPSRASRRPRVSTARARARAFPACVARWTTHRHPMASRAPMPPAGFEPALQP